MGEVDDPGVPDWAINAAAVNSGTNIIDFFTFVSFTVVDVWKNHQVAGSFRPPVVVKVVVKCHRSRCASRVER
jgi:hypothetical protein